MNHRFWHPSEQLLLLLTYMKAKIYHSQLGPVAKLLNLLQDVPEKYLLDISSSTKPCQKARVKYLINRTVYTKGVERGIKGEALRPMFTASHAEIMLAYANFKCWHVIPNSSEIWMKLLPISTEMANFA